MKHWLKQKQKLKRQKVTNIRKKNKRNVQKKITDAKVVVVVVVAFFGGGGGGRERKKITYTSL